ncbi:MAG: hypothetical protein HYX71_03895 [Opitutae bacterium]|nr:hypothetical protein [Opitutae bacterium]
MPPLTLARARETIRKLGLLAALSAAAFGGGGCATRGPNHVYYTTSASTAVHDLGPDAKEISNGRTAGEAVLGLAYDFNTDHLFLRLAGSIRVIERPSGKVLRDMPFLPDNSPAGEVVGTNTGPAGVGNGAHTTVSADLAIRSSDRHLFAVHPDGRSVVELTLFGGFVRRIELRGPAEPIGGLAFDQKNNRLLVLTTTHLVRIGHVSSEGSVTYCVTLAGEVRPVSLGYDSDQGHFFVPLADGNSLGEFAADGRLVATHATGPITALDAGPRSFLRVF